MTEVKEAVPYFKFCQKLGGVKVKDIYITPTKAATYLHLVKHCNRKEAMQFSQRRLCKWDTTIQMDGPTTCRILKPKESKERKLNGWQNVGIEKFYENQETIADLKQLELDVENDFIQKQIEKNEGRLKSDFKTKIANLQQFYSELSLKYRFDSKDPNFKDIVTKAKEDLQQQRSVPISYIKHQGVRYFELAKQRHQESMFDQFSIFKDTKISSLRVKSKLPDKLFQHQQGYENTHNLSEAYKSMEIESKAVLRMLESNDTALTKKKSDKSILTSKAMIFAEDYNQSRYLFKHKTAVAPTMPKIPENKADMPSTGSIKLHNRSSSIREEFRFEQNLQKHAYKLLSQRQKDTSLIDTSNIKKLIDEREQIRGKASDRYKKTIIHSKQYSLDLQKTSNESQRLTKQHARDASFQAPSLTKQRSYLTSPSSYKS